MVHTIYGAIFFCTWQKKIVQHLKDVARHGISWKENMKRRRLSHDFNDFLVYFIRASYSNRGYFEV